MLRYIKFRIHSGQKDENGVTRRAEIRQIESTMDRSSVNELLLILNALVGSCELVTEIIDFMLDSSRLDNDILG